MCSILIDRYQKTVITRQFSTVRSVLALISLYGSSYFTPFTAFYLSLACSWHLKLARSLFLHWMTLALSASACITWYCCARWASLCHFSLTVIQLSASRSSVLSSCFAPHWLLGSYLCPRWERFRSSFILIQVYLPWPRRCSVWKWRTEIKWVVFWKTSNRSFVVASASPLGVRSFSQNLWHPV